MLVAKEVLPQIEQGRSFDPQASVRMFRYDLEQFGNVLPETRERVYDEELSYVTEAVDRAARTEFALRRDEGGSLLYFSKGAWRPYTGMLMTGLRTAEQEAKTDPRKQFLAERAAMDLQYGYRMQKLSPGENVQWFSAYPEKEEKLYSKDFLRRSGFMPERKMGFLYRAECQMDGTIILKSQTVDKSDNDAFAAAMQEQGLNNALRAYDAELEKKNPGRRFYAGRDMHELERNAWDTIRAQKDLIRYFLDTLETIARSKLQGYELEHAVKRHTYGVWAALKKRLDGQSPDMRISSVLGYEMQQLHSVATEVQSAYSEFALLGKVLVGCGGAIEILQGESNILNARPEDVFTAIFGAREQDTDRFGPLEFKCTRGHTNRRPRNKLISKCHVKACKNSVSC